MRDVTERLRSEAAAHEMSDRFKQVVETIREAFWLTDVAKQTILYISPAYETIWGRSIASLMSSPESWLEAIHPDDRVRVRAAAMREQVNGTYDEEYRIVRPDGTERWIHDVAYPVREADGSVVRVVGVAEDVTERRKLEESLRQAQKMESIGQLAGGVAHDFNNALTVILGCVQLMEHERDVPERWRELLGEIHLAGERAASLTRQLLAFSRQELLSPKLLNLNASVIDTRRMLERLLGEDIRIVTRLDPSLPSVKVDPGHVVQLLMNLSVNARDAMPHGGTLEFTTRVVLHDAEYVRRHPHSTAGPFVELSVADTGTGIAPQVLAHLFEPFFTTKEVGRGTGLGLAVVHGIVTQNGGTIDVESREGVGTTFRIAFPAVQTRPADTESAPPLAHPSRHERILLVEDDDGVRRLALRALQSANYEVLSAADGVEALELLAKHGGTIDALVSDVVMPNMSGSDLAHGVKSICPSARILLTSGYTNDALSRNGVDQHELHFLQKPYSVASLLRAVRELFDGP
jgi:PAS domain S-box-containing protein